MILTDMVRNAFPFQFFSNTLYYIKEKVSVWCQYGLNTSYTCESPYLTKRLRLRDLKVQQYQANTEQHFCLFCANVYISFNLIPAFTYSNDERFSY